jgi:hypothetical protein
MKMNQTQTMAVKICALRPGAKDSFKVKNKREMSACYRAAESIGIKIGRQVDWADGGWRVIRFN